MKKEKRRWCAWALMALGLLLALPSLGFLMTADALLQYAIVAPARRDGLRSIRSRSPPAGGSPRRSFGGATG